MTKKAQRDQLKTQIKNTLQVKNAHYDTWSALKDLPAQLNQIATTLALANCAETAAQALRLAHAATALCEHCWQQSNHFHEKFVELEKTQRLVK